MNPLHRRLPRLEPQYYRGRTAVHWTLCIENRAQGWLTPAFHYRFREVLTHSCLRYGHVTPIYCLMPDHIHAMFWGVNDGANLYLAMKFLKEHTAQVLHPVHYQKQSYDHVLKDEETGRAEFEATCFYIAENPVRGKLCALAGEYPYLGSIIAGYPNLRVQEPFLGAVLEDCGSD